MKGWKLVKPFTLKEHDFDAEIACESLTKIKLTKSLITRSDVLRYAGDAEAQDVVLGGSGIGIIVEAENNLFGIEKGARVYIEPNRECSKCYNCKNGNYTDCSDLQVAGEDFNGFLCDFTTAPTDKIYALPDSVSDTDALFLGHISTALEIIDMLKIQKGDYVAVLGANSFGIIFAQLLMYYQAVPIVMTVDKESYTNAKNSGIYYVLDKEQNWQKEISIITGGRMAESVVYISDCDIPSSKSFAVASYNATVVFTGTTFGTSPSFQQAIKKQLNVLFINNGFGNTASSINLLANKAIDLSNIDLTTTTYNGVPLALKKAAESYKNDEPTNEIIVEMV